MNPRLGIAAAGLPSFLKKRELARLFRLTAEAFETAAPPLAGLNFAAALAAYANFTRDQAERVCGNAGLRERIEGRLFAGAVGLGAFYRRRLRLRGTGQALRAAEILYRALGIDLRSGPDGGITVCSCFFSDWYPPAVCRVVSALDAGLMAGLAGGGRLRFTQRLTEGADCCRARFQVEAEGESR